MFGSAILDVAIGMVFVYLLLALIVTSLSELISAVLKWRAKNLEKGIRHLLSDQEGEGLSQALSGHPLIKSLTKSDRLPSYIPSRTFALALLDIVSNPTEALKANLQKAINALESSGPIKKLQEDIEKLNVSGMSLTEFKQRLQDLINDLPANDDKTKLQKTQAENIINRIPTDMNGLIALVPNADVKRTLNVLLDDSGQNVEKFKENVEIWFNNSMERVSGWYKRKTQIINVVLAVFFTVLANADSILIAKALSSDPALRASLVTQAEKFAEQTAAQINNPQAPAPDTEDAQKRAEAAKKKLDEYRAEIQKLGVPIGWTSAEGDSRSYHLSGLGVLKKILGLLLTALALSLGAPFWFDMLNKVINIRSAGKAPEEEQKSPKKRPTSPEAGETPRQAAQREVVVESN
jgi:hypothetical protein